MDTDVTKKLLRIIFNFLTFIIKYHYYHSLHNLHLPTEKKNHYRSIFKSFQLPSFSISIVIIMNPNTCVYAAWSILCSSLCTCVCQTQKNIVSSLLLSLFSLTLPFVPNNSFDLWQKWWWCQEWPLGIDSRAIFILYSCAYLIYVMKRVQTSLCVCVSVKHLCICRFDFNLCLHKMIDFWRDGWVGNFIFVRHCLRETF